MEFDQMPAPKSSSAPLEADAKAPLPKPKEPKGAIHAKRLNRKATPYTNGNGDTEYEVTAQLSVGTRLGVKTADAKHEATKGYIAGLKGRADFTVISAEEDTCWVLFDRGVPEQYVERTADYILIVK